MPDTCAQLAAKFASVQSAMMLAQLQLIFVILVLVCVALSVGDAVRSR